MKEKYLQIGAIPFSLFYTLCFTTLFFTFYIFYPSKSIYTQQQQRRNQTGTNFTSRPEGFLLRDLNLASAEETNNEEAGTGEKENPKCDLFKGRWVPDEQGYTYYTNFSCTTIPFLRNCFLHGRVDRDFLHWRWKPDHCEIPRFNPRNFLALLRGKTMAFIGDSLARNQMESLLCLLSVVSFSLLIHSLSHLNRIAFLFLMLITELY